jgi:glycosyltransferase involved in cell wall biosynthesis
MLADALESLARQTYGDFETIIVLDDCWDDTWFVVEPYKDILDNCKIYSKSKKQGLAVAKNFGVEKCSGDWIAFLDADDEWMDCKLEVQRDYMLARPEIDFCGTNAWDRNPHTGILSPNCFEVGQYQNNEDIVNRLPDENVMCHGSMMIRRIALDSLGGYRTGHRYLGWEDYDLWQRAVENNFIFSNVPERLYIYTLETSVDR